MIPDELYFSKHSREKIHEIVHTKGLPNVGYDWVYGRVMNADGDLYRKKENPRYELFCPDRGDISIQYQVEIEGTKKKGVVVTVMHVTDPYGRYRRNGQWHRVEA